MKRYLQIIAWILGGLASLTANAQNLCQDQIQYSDWECIQAGATNSLGVLDFTNLNICAGETIIPPGVSGVTFYNGQKRRYVSHTCPEYVSQNHWETNNVVYTNSPVYLEPLASASTNLINGSFEMGFTGWALNNGGTILSPYAQASDGTNCAELGANNISGSTLSQSVPVTEGLPYALLFDNATLGDPNRTGILRVEIDSSAGILAAGSYTNSAQNTSPYLYQTKSVLFTAPFGVTNVTLRFLDMSPFNGIAVDPIIDNVRLSSGKIGSNQYIAKIDGIPIGGSCPKIVGIDLGTVTAVVSSTQDSDYDGFSDCQEIRDGTDPYSPAGVSEMWLGYWSFNNTNWIGDFGQTPLSYTNVEAEAGWNFNAIHVGGMATSKISYRDVEPNGWANINCKNGTIRFWFRPDWSSTTMGGTGPGTDARLLELGQETNGVPAGWWALVLNPSGTHVRFITQTNGMGTTNFTAPINWSSTDWHQLTLAYSPFASALYVDGIALVTNGLGVVYIPSPIVRSAGFRIGSDQNGTRQAKGRFDDLETYNYPQTAEVINNVYAKSINQIDANVNDCVLRPITIPDSVVSTLQQNDTFTVQRGTGPGNFSWVEGNKKDHTSPETLAAQLVNASGFAYISSLDPSVNIVTINSEISGVPGKKSASGIRDSLDWLIANQVPIAIPVWGSYSGNGANLRYVVSGYANVVLTDYSQLDENNVNNDLCTFTFRYLGSSVCDNKVNEPPRVDISGPTSVILPLTVNLIGTVADDGLPTPPHLTYQWSDDSNTGNVSFSSQSAPNTTATFSAPGIYKLRLTVSDGELTGFNTITITVYANCVTAEVSQFQLASPTVIGGSIVQGTVTMSATVTRAGGQVITIDSDSEQAVAATSVLVPRGADSATFEVQTLGVSSTTMAHLTASYPGTPSVPVALEIDPVIESESLPVPNISGFSYSVFASGFGAPQGIGPLGIAKNSIGQVMVSLFQGDYTTGASVAIFPTSRDNQNVSDSGIGFAGFGESFFGMATLNDRVYAVGGSAVSGSGIAELANDGTVIRFISVAPNVDLIGLAANAKTGLLYATADSSGEIYEIDPVSESSRTVVETGHYLDGIALSPDGTTVYVAALPENSVFGYDVATGANVFSINLNDSQHQRPDGIASGQGSLAGNLFVNCGDGSLLEIDVNTGTVSVLCDNQGGRGDFVAVDDDGSLLITQPDRILRLTPPSGGSFGAKSGTIITRNDRAEAHSGIALGGDYYERASTEPATFDLRGFSGDVLSASVYRAGAINYVATSSLDLESGVLPFDPLSFNPLDSVSFSPRNVLPASASGSLGFAPQWDLPLPYLEDIRLHVGGYYQLQLVDRISGICGSADLTDNPQMTNAITVLLFGNNPEIPAGSCLDISLPGAEPPANGTWDIMLNNTIVASSGNSDGWDVELDSTPYHGAIVTVPSTAQIASGYQVRTVAAVAASGSFDVIPSGRLIRAPALLPLRLSQKSADPGSSVLITVGLDRPAPPSGVKVYLEIDNPSVTLDSPSVAILAGSSEITISATVSAGASAGIANISASYNGSRRSAFQITTGTGNLPDVPSVTATGSANLITLDWAFASGVNYNIKRSRNSGGPYTTIFSGLNTSTYHDRDVINGSRYYYVVRAVNNFGESGDSAEVNATPFLGQVATPSASPPTGNPQIVTFTDATPGAIIRYTLDDSDPTEASPVYQGPITISVSTRVKLKAFKVGYLPSAIAANLYTIMPVSHSSPFIDCGIVQEFALVPDAQEYSYRKGQAFNAKHFRIDIANMIPSVNPGDKVIITMSSSAVDSYLCLSDDEFAQNVLAENDDAVSEAVNSRIEYTIPEGPLPLQYFIEATTARPGQDGSAVIYVNTGHCSPSINLSGIKFDGSLATPVANVMDIGPAYIGSTPTGALTIANNSGTVGLDVQAVEITGDFVGGGSAFPTIPHGKVLNVPIRLAAAPTVFGVTKTGTITIRYNASGSPTVLNITAAIADPNDAPDISIASPLDGSSFSSGNIEILANANSPHAKIAKVEFYSSPAGQNTFTRLGQANTAPYEFNWINAPGGTYDIKAIATDTMGLANSAVVNSISVTVPTLSGQPNIMPGNGTYAGSVTVTIDSGSLSSGPPDTTLIYTTEPGDSAQWHIYHPNQPLIFTYDDVQGNLLTLRARGVKSGVLSLATTANYTLTPPSQTYPPVAHIEFPKNGSEVTGPISVIGEAELNINDPVQDDFGFWRLEYRAHDDQTGAWLAFASGDSSVGSGTEFDSNHKFDPRLLLNGLYDIRLTVANAAGDIATENVTVTVRGRQKVGNFTLTFTDLSVPVAGTSVDVTRTYDSRDKEEGDFGIGWRLSLSNVRVQKSGVIGSGWRQNLLTQNFIPYLQISPVSPHTVTITFPDEQVYSFEATLNPSLNAFEPVSEGTIRFVPTGGTPSSARLVPLSNHAPLDTEIAVNPAAVSDSVVLEDSEEQIFDADEFDLTTPDGQIYRVTVSGGLEQVTDLNGNIILFDSAGIYKLPNGVQTQERIVTFVHGNGLHPKRITAIHLENGNTIPIQYGYGASGGRDADNLLTVIDRTINTTRFAYDEFHNVVDIIDPMNHHAVRNTYDDLGRLTQSTDAQNHTTSYNYDDVNHSETITDALNNITKVYYDNQGNVITKTEILKADATHPTDVEITTRSEYADSVNPNKPTSIIDPLGRETRFSYSSSGDLLTESDSMGHTTTCTYNVNGQLESIVGPRGVEIVRNAYDENGNFIGPKDAFGVEKSRSTYNDDGTLASTTDVLGHTTQYFYNETAPDPVTGSPILADPGKTGLMTSMVDPNNNRVRFFYDVNGRQRHMVQTRSRRVGATTTTESIDTKYDYDNEGRVVTTTISGLDGTFQKRNHYNANGKLDYTIDYNGQQTSYFYDELGHLIQIETPDVISTYIAYDAIGRKVSTTDKAGRVTRYIFDSLSRQTAVIYPDGSSITTEYDDAGQVVAVVDPNGNRTKYEYDDAGRRTKVIDALGHYTSFEYDDDGRQVSITDAGKHRIQYDYDDNGSLVKTTYADGTTRKIEYGVAGRKLAEIDQAGVKTGYGYDDLGHLAFVTNAVGTTEEAITEFRYNELGKLITQFDANQFSKIEANKKGTSFEYDDLGRIITRTLPDLSSETFTYSIINGNLRVQHSDFNNRETILDYDEMGRLLSKTPDPTLPPAVVFTYYAETGLPNTMSDASGTTTYTYDNMLRLKRKSHSLVGDLSYTYDFNGNVLSIQSSHQNGVSLTYTWDKLNRLKQVKDAADNVTTYNYADMGNLTEVTYPTTTPIKTSLNYNSINWLTSVIVEKGTVTPISVASFDYDPMDRPLGASGNRMAARETIGTVNRSVNYSYDSRYRVTREDILSDSGASAPVGSVDYTGGNGYDLVGNRQSRTVNLSPAVTGFGNLTAIFDDNDRPNNSTYDPNGNTWTEALPLRPRSSTPIVPDSNHKDHYDFEDHLTQRSDATVTIQITYDGNGDRIKKFINGGPNAGTTYYLVDDHNASGFSQVLEELVPDAGSLAVSRVYNYGHNLISQSVKDGVNWDLRYFGYDGHGNVRFLLNEDGNITDTFTYDAFGVLLKDTGSSPNNYLYCGEQFDFDLGTYYLRARYMNPNSGRFWTMDSYQGNNSDPASLHKYLYVGANSVNRIDPSGHEDMCEMLTVSAIETGLFAMIGPVINHVAGKALVGLLPPGLLESAGFFKPDAFVLGAALNANIATPDFPLGVAGTGGSEFLRSLKKGGKWNEHAAAYLYAGGGISLGPQTASAGASVYGGLTFSTEGSKDYTMTFNTISVPFSVIKASGKINFKKAIDNINVAYDLGVGEHELALATAISEFKSLTAGGDGVLNKLSFNIFWSPMSEKETPWGFSAGIGASWRANGTSNPSYILSSYKQVWPAGKDGDAPNVPFR